MRITNDEQLCVFVFFFNDTATTEIYTLSLHDALPICRARGDRRVVAEHRARLGGGGRLGHSDSERISMGVVRSPVSVSRIELSALSRTIVGWWRAASSGVICA